MGESLLEVTELQRTKLRDSDGWAVTLAETLLTQDKKRRGGYEPGWVVSNPGLVSDLTDNLLLKILG